MNKVIVILGSSRNDGDSKYLADALIEHCGSELIDLNNHDISYYDYNHHNRNDDFIPVIKLLLDYELFIFITPVYWYSMSGILKVFFDRFTDLLTIEKEIGRRLNEKKMMVITTSNGDNLGADFWLPFQKTAEYLGINFVGGFHTLNGVCNNLSEELKNKIIL